MVKSNQYKFLLFLLSPFISLLLALKEIKAPSTKNIVWAFTIFYGFTFVILSNEIDADRYKNDLIIAFNDNYSLNEFIGTLYVGKQVDILQQSLTYLVSKFTDNYRILFALFGLIYGYFYSRNMWFFIERTNSKLSMYAILVMATFLFVLPIWSMNGFRFWTASHIFFYGLIQTLNKNSFKGYFYCLTTPLVHFSFLFGAAIFLIYKILGNRRWIYFSLFIISLFITEVDTAITTTIETSLPDIFSDRASGYMDEEYIEHQEKKISQVNWYVELHEVLLNWLLIFSLIFTAIRLNKKTLSKFIYSWFNFALLFYSIANIVGLLSSGVRFLTIAHMITIALLFSVFSRKELSYYKIPGVVRVISVPVFILFIIVSLRLGFDTLGVSTIFGNPFTVLLGVIEIPLIELIK